tara:strand:- start:127 stop:600 length:474 start_codon:yes stop_codon:yes gene_type:complete
VVICITDETNRNIKEKKMEKNIEKMRKEFGNGLEKYLTKNDHMKEMSKKDLLDWIFTEYVVNHKLEGVEGLLGLTQSYEKGNVFDFEEIEVVGVWNHDIYGTLRGDKMMLPKSSDYKVLYDNDKKLDKYRTDRAKVKEVIEKIVEEPDEFYNESEAK